MLWEMALPQFPMIWPMIWGIVYQFLSAKSMICCGSYRLLFHNTILIIHALSSHFPHADYTNVMRVCWYKEYVQKTPKPLL